MSRVETSRHPRSDVEATFIKLQEESDRAGVIIYSQYTWKIDEPASLAQTRNDFVTYLDRFKSFASTYIGEPGVEVGIKARYLYDLDKSDRKRKTGNQQVYSAELPELSLYYLAPIAGKIDEITAILAKNPLSGDIGWRVCLIIQASDVMGFHINPNSKQRAKIAVPLSEILTFPVKREEQESLMVVSA